jgi:single-strand DNA-binding protein
MANINIVMAMGRITKQPEVKHTQGGTVVLNFSVATNRSWKNANGEKQEEVEFINVVAFGNTAETIAKWFNKGDEIFVQGRLKTSSWDDKNGEKKYRTDVILDRFDFGQKVRTDGGQQTTARPAQPARPVAPARSPEEELGIDPASQANRPANDFPVPGDPDYAPAPTDDDNIRVENIPF